MSEYSSLSVTKISEVFNIPGYILDSNTLSKIDELSLSIVTKHKKRKKIEKAFWVTNQQGEVIKFDTFEKFFSFVNSEKDFFSSIILKYIVVGEVGISIEFTNKGKIELSAYGNAIDFQFDIDQLIREIQKCDQEYNGFIKNLIIKRDLSRLFTLLISGISFLLLYSVGFYSYASNVGVNINPSVIPNGNEYFKQVEHALQSDDLSEKLNVLLTSQLKGFANVQDILQRTQTFSVFLLISLTIVVILFFLFKFIKKLYPLAFFEFEANKKVLSDIYRKRDIVWVGVILGFAVNIIAGLAIAFLEK